MAHFTSAMIFAPVHGGCYTISSVWIEYSCGMSVMWCILSVYTLLKVVKSHCDLSVMAVSLMGFHKKLYDLSSIPFLWDFLSFFNFAKPLTP